MTLPDALFLLVGGVSLVASVGLVGWMVWDGVKWVWGKWNGIREGR